MDPTTAALEKEHEAVSYKLHQCFTVSKCNPKSTRVPEYQAA